MVNNCTSDQMKLKYGVPQGSKLGPILFNTYIAPLSEIAERHNVQDQIYAVDEQLPVAFTPKDDDANADIVKMEKCIEDIRIFLNNNKLSNNGEKTEIIILGPKIKLDTLQIRDLKLDGLDINYSNDLKNLGVVMDKNMTMSK